MKCPNPNKCACTSSTILETQGFSHKRVCNFCRHVFWTKEVLDLDKKEAPGKFKQGPRQKTIADLPKPDKTKNAFGQPLKPTKPTVTEAVPDPDEDAEDEDIPDEPKTALQKKIAARHRVEDLQMERELARGDYD